MKHFSANFPILLLSAFGATGALASEQGFTAIGCIELYEMEASGVGSSCAVIGREKNAESRATDALEADGRAECQGVDDHDPEFWLAYCQMVCENNGYEDTSGFSMCSYQVTDTDTWEESGCFTGDRQYNRQEADVQCGCACSSRL